MAREKPFVPRVDDEDTLWEVDITAENARKYQVVWAGTDPDTGKPWGPSWVDKGDCTDQAVARWEARKKEKLMQSRNEPGTDERAAIPVDHDNRKRQREDTQDKGPHDVNNKKSKKQVPPLPVAATASSSTVKTNHASPAMKIGPPRGANRKKEKQTPTEVSRLSVPRSSQNVSNSCPPAVKSSGAGTSLSDSIHSCQEGTSDGEAKCSQVASPASDMILPTLASTSAQTAQTPPSPSPFLKRIEDIKELQYGISISSNAALKLAIETAPVSVSAQGNMKEIERLQCQISIASNATLKLVLETIAALGTK